MISGKQIILDKKISVIIPNYNGKEVLQLCLPSVVKALELGSDSFEILVVDDGSTDDSKEYLKSTFPSIRVLETPERKGQENALNLGYVNASHDIVVQLDSDARIAPDFCRHIFDHFQDEAVFAVAPRVMDWSGKELVCGRAQARFRRGSLSIFSSPSDRSGDYSLFASGCAAVFHRKKVLALGGYDLIYDSAHLDEIDLAYRAWKRGWKIIFEPRSVAYHLGSATRSKVFVDRRLAYLKARNEWLFVWKNLSDWEFLAKHALWLPARLLSALFRGNTLAVRSFLGALGQIGSVVRQRRVQAPFRKMKDRQILGQLERATPKV